jgi:hypothetical protein
MESAGTAFQPPVPSNTFCASPREARMSRVSAAEALYIALVYQVPGSAI